MLSIAEQGSGFRYIWGTARIYVQLAIVAILSSALSGYAAPQQPRGKNVLVLFGALRSDPQFMDLIVPVIRARVSGPITFYEEYLVNYPSGKQEFYQESKAETFRRQYAGAMRPDVVIAVRPQAALFAIQYRDRMFPGVPVVFANMAVLAPTDWPRIFADLTKPGLTPSAFAGTTGVLYPIALSETVDLALRLHPDTTNIAAITGIDGYMRDAIRAKLLPYKDKIKEIEFTEPPSRALLAKVDALPPHTIVLYDLPPDPRWSEFGGRQLLAGVAQRWPTYSPFEWICLDHGGCIGGVYGDNDKQAKTAGEIAARVLLGAKTDDISVVYQPELHAIVDWRQLRRWNVPESALPPGTRVLFREPSLWEQGRKYFLAGIAVIVVQAVSIFALFRQRARRRKAEEKFSKSFRRSPLAITIVDTSHGRYIDVNEAFELHTGWKREEVIGRSPLEIDSWVDPDQRTTFMKQLSANGNVKDLEVRFRRKDGQVRTGLGSAELIELNGEQCALSVIADITERKQAEEAMASVSSRLIEAQEAERTRIARELHDDINQRLALVAIILESTKRDLPTSAIKTNRQLEEATAQIRELGEDIHALSHRLHSSRLEYLGLEVAASGFCREISERQNVKIDFHSADIPEGLSDQVSLCLFRVLQEALHNAVKYSGVDEFDVSFTGTSGEIELRVHDSGVGFDPKEASKGHGLGQISMKERLKLVSGELSIDSKPGHGTTILARVPLACDRKETGYSDEKSLDSTNKSVQI